MSGSHSPYPVPKGQKAQSSGEKGIYVAELGIARFYEVPDLNVSPAGECSTGSEFDCGVRNMDL